MATGNTTLLGLALPVNGELAGTWGTTVNDSLTSLVDSAVAGTTTLSANADVTLTDTALAANQARQAVILWTASNGGTTRNITAPARSKPYIVINAGTGSIVIRGAGPTTGVTVPSGTKALVAWNGSDFVKVASNPAVLTTDVSGILPIANGGTGTSSTTFTNLTTNVTGTLPIANGGTGTTSTTFANLTTNVTGTLPIANGGTGATTLTANNVLLGNGTSALQVVAPGTSGNVLTSNGTTWTSAAAGAALSGVTDSAFPFETALGHQAGNVNTGANNTFIGYQAGLLTTSGTDNVAVGFRALDANTTGNGSIAVGSTALGANTTGTLNTAVGGGALQTNTTGNFNVAVGYTALDANTTASLNTAVGYAALRANTTANSNTAIGNSALEANTTGASNTSVGAGSLDANTTASNNTAIGKDALGANTTGASNTSVGAGALDANTTGDDNVAMGRNALGVNTVNSANTVVGTSALFSATADDNSVFGKSAGFSVTTGARNTILGSGAASSGTNDLTTGDNNIIIGYNSAASSASVSNEITLGNSSITKLRVPGLSVDWAVNDVPFRNIPQNSQSAAYTLVAADAGKHIFHPSADTTARTFTIPANSSVAYPIGTAITFINQDGAGVITIAITTDTMRLSPAGTTGSRTLAANGSATCIKVTSTEWLISGSGLT
jgi:hypothetical protein